MAEWPAPIPPSFPRALRVSLANEGYMTAARAAALLGVSLPTFHRISREGGIPHTTYPGYATKLYKLGDVYEFWNQNLDPKRMNDDQPDQ